MRIALLCASLATLTAVCGCGANSPSCTDSLVVTVSPTAATASHSAAPPGNQTHFVGVAQPQEQPGCAIPNIVALYYASWANPDPTDIQISSANDSTNGTAVCVAPTGGAVTLTGTFSPVTANGPAGSGPNPIAKTVQMTCD